LLSSLLATVGLANSAGEVGLNGGGFVSLETIIAAQPDLILVAEAAPSAEDQGKALLLHPALDRNYPPERRIVVPEQLTICGGPMLPAALDRLSEAMTRITRSPGP
jgi:iron complex transport system substrate-binding protein